MKALRDRILKDGKCFPDGILKVDKFINHQMDPNLMKQICVEFIRRYASTEINKIITIEASGIAPAIMMGFLLDLPVVFDFLAYGNAAKGIIDLCKKAGAELVGMGFIIEKAFQHGRDAIEAAGVRCESLAIIESLENCEIKMRET